MKAVAIFPSKKKLQIIEHPEPEIKTGTDVKVRILEVGICGTDKELCSFVYGIPPEKSDYLIIGHESLAEVVETGSAVTRVKKGDLVVMSVRRPCFHDYCVPCISGYQDFCYTGDFTERGIKQAHGFMTEYVVDDEKYMFIVPTALRQVGVLTEPLTIAEKALKGFWAIKQRLPWLVPQKKHAEVRTTNYYDHQAVVLGAGPVGLLGAMALLGQQFKTCVYSTDTTSSKKAALARSIGANYICAHEHTAEQLQGYLGSIDLVYEAAGVSEAAFKLLKVLGTNGVFIFTGVPAGQSAIPLEAAQIMQNIVLKNQSILGVVNASDKDFESAIQDLNTFMTNWPETVPKLITEYFSLADEQKLQEVLHGHVRGSIKNVIKF